MRKTSPTYEMGKRRGEDLCLKGVEQKIIIIIPNFWRWGNETQGSNQGEICLKFSQAEENIRSGWSASQPKVLSLSWDSRELRSGCKQGWFLLETAKDSLVQESLSASGDLLMIFVVPWLLLNHLDPSFIFTWCFPVCLSVSKYSFLIRTPVLLN